MDKLNIKLPFMTEAPPVKPPFSPQFKIIRSPVRTRNQGVQVASHAFHHVLLSFVLLIVWLIGYYKYNLAWVLILLFTYLVRTEYKILKASHTPSTDKDAADKAMARIEELPSWVYFPDVERAEWINQILKQLWPFVGAFARTSLKDTVQHEIDQALPGWLSLRFLEIELGDVPPRIGGVKVYIDNVKRSEIFMDLELICATDAEFKISLNKIIRAGIKDILFHGTIRIAFSPIIDRIPVIGEVSVYFLKQPVIDFDLTHVLNFFDLPILSWILRANLMDVMNMFFVLPNRFSVQLADDLESLNRIQQPVGVVQIEIVEAAELMELDFGVLTKGKSDPYVLVSAGGKSYRTEVINNTSTPVWNEVFEFVITDNKPDQLIELDVFDRDPNIDDRLGSSSVDIDSLKSGDNDIDTWLKLENIKTGKLHVKVKWFYLTADPMAYSKIAGASSDLFHSTAVLVINVDSVRNLPSADENMVEPSPVVRLEMGNAEQRTAVKRKTPNPNYMETFNFLVADPKQQEIYIEVLDTSKKEAKLGVLTFQLDKLLLFENMTLSQPFSLEGCRTPAIITLTLSLKIFSMMPPDTNRMNKGTGNKGRSNNNNNNNSSSNPPTSSGTNNSSESLLDFSSGDSAQISRRCRPTTNNEGLYGRLQLTIRYSVTRQRLVVVIHKCINLPACDQEHEANHYVRVRFLPKKFFSSDKKTVVQKNSLSPIFDETFDWQVSQVEMQTRILDIAVKNAVGLFSQNSTTVARLQLNLKDFDDLTKTLTDWFNLEGPHGPDSAEQVSSSSLPVI